MMDQDAVEHAASEAARSLHGGHVMLVHPSGRTGWTINFRSAGRFRTVNIPVDADTTEADVQRLIEEKLSA